MYHPLGKAIVWLLLLSAMSLFVTNVQGQLTANFETQNGIKDGCSPLSITFINKTTGASASAVYTWNFGNGNTVTTTDATTPLGATYSEEKSYTVTLTVVDGAQTSTHQTTITVYKKPIVDFTFTPAKGCAPLVVHFDANAQPGDGAISGYFWDFGNGNITSGPSMDTVSNIYNFPGINSVSLTVINNHGCQSTTTKPLAVEVLPAIKAMFTPASDTICNRRDSVQFTNSTTWVEPLTYQWQFGDGNTSNATHPKHSYGVRGSFNVTLTAMGAYGCSATYTHPKPLVVPNYFPAFSYPTPVCTGNQTIFTNQTTPKADTVKWQIGTTNIISDTTVAYTFATAGDYPVKIISVFKNCAVDSVGVVTVNATPAPGGFTYVDTAQCGAPTTVQFFDTSASTSRIWQFDINNPSVTDTSRNPTFTYTDNGTYSVNLTVKNAAGCSTTITRDIVISKPDIQISHFNSTSPFATHSCEAFTVSFRADPDSNILNYWWQFGDGAVSTDSAPTHTYNTYGVFDVKLVYYTKQGCYDSTVYQHQVKVYELPVANFTGSRVWCGNTPVDIADSSTGKVEEWMWDFGDGNGLNGMGPVPGYKYQDTGLYTITLVVRNGVCFDTITKEDYIRILPPFPRAPRNPENTCAGQRGLVSFTDSTTQATTWTWDFGDASTPQTFTTLQSPVLHEYTQTGVYKVMVTAVNGQCTVKDSTLAYVLLKQSPVLTGALTELCSKDSVRVFINNLERNPHKTVLPFFPFYGYRVTGVQYGDGSTYNHPTYLSDSINWQQVSFDTSFSFVLKYLQAGKQDIRIIQTSTGFGCTDTTNLIPLKIKGPIASFTIADKVLCINEPVVMTDASQATHGIPIVNWAWDFGDGSTQTGATGVTVSHLYQDPANIITRLRVTDADGCWDTTSATSGSIIINGPEADFTWTPPFVEPGMNVTYINQSKLLNATSVSYRWHFNWSNFTTTQPTNVVRNYPVIATDTVTLIATSATTNCADTITKVVPVKAVHALFSFTTEYVNNNSCPPLIAYFTSNSVNASHLQWNFGDGGTANDNPTPAHTYYLPGVYTVTLYAFSPNNMVDSMKATIIVKGPYAELHSTVTQGCAPLSATLYATSANISSYTWDFGDGTLVNGTDTFATHDYKNPGVYRPALIMKDSFNCAATFQLPQRILVDSLDAKFVANSYLVCDSGFVLFTPFIKNIGQDSMGDPVKLHWEFGTNAADTSIAQSPVFKYTTQGQYLVKLTATSAAGCVKTYIDTIDVKPRAKGIVSGPASGCDNVPVKFTASSALGGVSWLWLFDNGNTSTSANPPAQPFAAGNYSVQLITERQGCKDTTVYNIIIHSKPNVAATPQQETICRGASVQLKANDAVTYQWTPNTGLSNATIANPIASPIVSRRYYVDATNVHGCSNRDSVLITVIQPVSVQVVADTFVCIGSSLQLNATGADSYQWIGNTSSLSNTNIANPVATPASNVVYTVVGKDANNCFSDTVKVKVTVQPLPTVNAGADRVVLTGSKVEIKTTNSPDVVSWLWSPADYLNCSTCKNVVSTPKSDIQYIVTATSKWGCKRSDSVAITLKCNELAVHIPTAFTPNNDGLNEIFYPMGAGVKIVKELRIFNRWGELVFENKNFNLNISSTGWNGMYKGEHAPPGTYVYATTMICDTGEEFSLKGTVTLIR